MKKQIEELEKTAQDADEATLIAAREAFAAELTKAASEIERGESERGKSLVARARIKVIRRHREKLTEADRASLKEKCEAWLERQYHKRKWLLFLVIAAAVAVAAVACFFALAIKTLFNVFLVSTSLRACAYSCSLPRIWLRESEAVCEFAQSSLQTPSKIACIASSRIWSSRGKGAIRSQNTLRALL